MGDGLFPHPLLRKGQAEFLADARAAVAEGAVLLAQAPTGLGKTAVALSATLEAALAGDRRVLYATCRRSQHRIAVETARRIVDGGTEVRVVDLVAREAMCPEADHGPGARDRVQAVAEAIGRWPLHVQEAMELARRFGVCPHRVALTAARVAHLLVCDYNHVFGPEAAPVQQALGAAPEDLLVVVDEAHNLPGRCRDALSRRLTVRSLDALAAQAPRKAARALRAVAGVLAAEARFVGGDSKVPPDFLDRFLARALPGGRGRPPSRRLLRLLEAVDRVAEGDAQRAVREVGDLLRGWGEPGVLRLLSRQGGGALVLRALDPRPATAPVLRRVAAALLMSGTLYPGEMYVDLLGLPDERVRVRSYRPDFPPDHRLLVVSRHLSLAYKLRPGVYGPLAREIDRLARAIPGNAAAFFPSYEVAREVGSLLAADPPKPLLWERRGQTKAEKEGLLRRLEAAREGPGSLLLAIQGGSLSEGIDYPGNLLRAVLVVGLALRPPRLEAEALRAHYARLFGRRKGYEYAVLVPALHRLVQCAGRCIRGPEDVAAVVVLDNRLLRPFYRSRLPPGFEPEAPPDLAAAVRSFFYGGPHRTARVAAPGRGGGHHPDGVARAPGRGEAPDPEGVPGPRPRPGAAGRPGPDGGPSLP